MRTLPLILAASLSTTSMAFAESVDTKTEVTQAATDWMTLYNKRDAAGVAATYTDDAVLSTALWTAAGKAAIAGALTKDFAAGVTLTSLTVDQSHRDGDVNYATAPGLERRKARMASLSQRSLAQCFQISRWEILDFCQQREHPDAAAADEVNRRPSLGETGSVNRGGLLRRQRRRRSRTDFTPSEATLPGPGPRSGAGRGSCDVGGGVLTSACVATHDVVPGHGSTVSMCHRPTRRDVPRLAPNALTLKVAPRTHVLMHRSSR